MLRRVRAVGIILMASLDPAYVKAGNGFWLRLRLTKRPVGGEV